jgi:multicomponent Na+:H+ antiporter subunit B
LPLFGEIELASALVFDIGIFCVVVGGLLTIFSVVGAE